MNGITTALLVMFLLAHAVTLNAEWSEQIEANEKRIIEQQRQLDAMREELEALKKAAGTPAVIGEEQAPSQTASEDIKPEPDHGPIVIRRSESAVLTLGATTSLSPVSGMDCRLFLVSSLSVLCSRRTCEVRRSPPRLSCLHSENPFISR